MEGAAETATASASFDFVLESEDQEALRWYWEDYLEYAVESAPDIAAEIESKLTAIGLQLFQSTFPSGAAQELWQKFHPQLSAGRVEVITREGEGVSAAVGAFAGCGDPANARDGGPFLRSETGRGDRGARSSGGRESASAGADGHLSSP